MIQYYTVSCKISDQLKTFLILILNAREMFDHFAFIHIQILSRIKNVHKHNTGLWANKEFFCAMLLTNHILN